MHTVRGVHVLVRRLMVFWQAVESNWAFEIESSFDFLFLPPKHF